MSRIPLLAGFGIEMEYMIVDSQSLNVKPIADLLIEEAAGEKSNEVNNERVDWSNELVCHVVELKNNKPEPEILALEPHFDKEVARINTLLGPHSAELLPGACHPWMNPDTETKLWPLGNNEIYSTYNKLFGCKGHGWSNLQSMHINISFSTDPEFEKLHSAIRVILPLVPALSSSSPVIDGVLTGLKSNRLNHYLRNQKKVPSIMGLGVPEMIRSEAQYQTEILERMYKDIAPLDTENILQEEWLNSRGAIPKFERGCIEIRLADLNEFPGIDLGIAHFWRTVITQMCRGEGFELAKLQALTTEELRSLLDQTVKDAEDAVIDNARYLDLFGLKGPVKARDILTHLLESQSAENARVKELLQKGTLSTRLLSALSGDTRREKVREVYKALTVSLQSRTFFSA